MWPQSHGPWDGNQSDNVYSVKMTTILHGHSNFRAATQRALDNFLWFSKCDPTFFFNAMQKANPEHLCCPCRQPPWAHRDQADKF